MGPVEPLLVGGGGAGRGGRLVESSLALGELVLAGGGGGVAGGGLAIAFVGDAVSFVGEAIALVGNSVASIGDRLLVYQARIVACERAGNVGLQRAGQIQGGVRAVCGAEFMVGVLGVQCGGAFVDRDRVALDGGAAAVQLDVPLI